MNTEIFRNDLRKILETSGMSQSDLSRLSGVKQYNISKFLKGEREILLSTALRLWPFVYGHSITTTPTTPPAGAPEEGGENA